MMTTTEIKSNKNTLDFIFTMTLIQLLNAMESFLKHFQHFFFEYEIIKYNEQNKVYAEYAFGIRGFCLWMSSASVFDLWRIEFIQWTTTSKRWNRSQTSFGHSAFCKRMIQSNCDGDNKWHSIDPPHWTKIQILIYIFDSLIRIICLRSVCHLFFSFK